MNHPVWADIVAVIHVAFVTFVIVGFVLLLAGRLLQWRWVRHRGLRVVHLACVMYTLVRTLLGHACPLTTLENFLRGATPDPLDAIARWSHRLIFRGAGHQPFAWSVVVFSALVLTHFILTSERIRGRRGVQPPRSAPLPCA